MITIRVATPADDEALADVDQRTWTSAVSPAPAPAPGTPFFRDGSRPCQVLVAEVDGDVAGYVALRTATALASRTHVVEISGLAVAPHLQGRGVGAHLVAAAVVEAAERGGRKVSLRVLGTNGSARRLYERSGFAVEGVLRDEFLLDRRYVDDILMARNLADAKPSSDPSTADGRVAGQDEQVHVDPADRWGR